MSNALVKTEQLTFSYHTGEGESPVVLNGVDLQIEEGSFVAVLGHNGSGKSTLAKHMNAILLPTGGKVWVGGMDTTDEA
jgi:energy-coupling factor transport system ATP-binding protein